MGYYRHKPASGWESCEYVCGQSQLGDAEKWAMWCWHQTASAQFAAVWAGYVYWLQLQPTYPLFSSLPLFLPSPAVVRHEPQPSPAVVRPVCAPTQGRKHAALVTIIYTLKYDTTCQKATLPHQRQQSRNTDIVIAIAVNFYSAVAHQKGWA